jgi:hypothetical protein
VIAAGLIVSAAGLALLAAADGFALIILANIVMSIGFTPVITMTTGLIVGSAPPEKTGVASAISETGAELGGALGVALLGSLGTAIYRSFMADKIAPGLSPEASEAARMTLGGAVEAAKTLPGVEGAAMVDAARETFMTGFHLSALISTIALLAAAWMTKRVLGGEGKLLSSVRHCRWFLSFCSILYSKSRATRASKLIDSTRSKSACAFACSESSLSETDSAFACRRLQSRSRGRLSSARSRSIA